MTASNEPEPGGGIADPLTADEFRQIIGHFASGVTIITGMSDGEPVGTTASAVSSLSLSPPMVLISMNLESRTGEVIDRTKKFGLNILSDSQADLAIRFAGKGGDKFAGVDIVTGEHGMPLLAGALATMECKVVDQVGAATHVVFLAEVEGAAAASGSPLAYFRGEFGRLQLARDNLVLEELRRRIVNRELPIDRPLSVAEVASSFDLPEDATHYALISLTFDGLVVIEGGGFLMRPLTLELIEDALAARRLIELGALVAGIEREDGDLESLRNLAELTDPARYGGEVESWVAAYVAFHEALVGIAGSDSAIEAYRRLNTPPMVLSFASERAAGRQGQAAAQAAHGDHRELVAALEARDLARALEVAERHYADSVAFARLGIKQGDRT
jgi:flavin reductase (DIM6/NTAB) family NADH-FMN oxidoreductase RutF/DNA-binding GntR family transcriptional regulator